MATTRNHPPSETWEAEPWAVAAVRRRRLAAKSRPPANDLEAIQLADWAQVLVADSVDPGHRTFAMVWGKWRDANPGDVIESQG